MYYFNACTDEEIISSTKVEAGIPVEVQLGMSISGMSEVSTRSLDEDAESQVNDLYVLVFDANSQQKRQASFSLQTKLSVQQLIRIKEVSF